MLNCKVLQMYKEIVIAQDINELKFIIKNIKESNFYCLPLSLELQLYCENNKIPFIDISKFSDNELHKKIQQNTELILKKNKIKFLKLESIKKNYYRWLEHKLTGFFFLYFIINSINKKNKIKKIFTSGWNKTTIYYGKNYFISLFLKKIFKNIKVLTITPILNEKLTVNNVKFFEANLNIKKNKKKIIFLNNLSYNFKRILFWTYKNNYSVVVPFYRKINIFKRIVLTFFKIYPLEITETTKQRKNNTRKNLQVKLPKILFKEHEISEIIYQDKNSIINYFTSEQNKVLAVQKIFKNNSFKLIMSNMAVGIDGGYLEIGKKLNIKTLNIPHGSLNEHFNKEGKIFNTNLSKQIYSKHAINAMQSKISLDFVKKNNIRKKDYIISGNLIFNNVGKTNGKKILFALKNKDFWCYRSYGIETFYETLNCLSKINILAKNIEKKIYIKPHPGNFSSIEDLKIKYKNLYFTKESNKSLFKKIYVTITYSSTIAEDSLYSNIPVILFDPYKRYKFCKSEENVSKKNSAVYYVNGISDLLKCLKTVAESKSIKFNKYILSNNIKSNYNKLMYKITL